uniref:Uncharacterized protein n=1 Tax=Caenorhabditis japonica TaxID=281687 RepID=A0A8R1EJ97_CAEJA
MYHSCVAGNEKAAIYRNQKIIIFRSSHFVIPLMRKFSPLAEDLSTLTKALCWNAVTSEKSEKSAATVSSAESGLDFLDEEDIPFAGFRERTISCGQSSLINYSATPGLKSFNV